MKCISIRQPWAWAILYGGKDIENRNWKTNYRGLVAIHAGKQFDMTGEDQKWLLANGGEPYVKMLQDFCEFEDNDVRGAIVGVVEITDCIPSHSCESPWKAGPDPDFFCWQLANPRALAMPIALKGQLGLFDLPSEVAQMITSQLEVRS